MTNQSMLSDGGLLLPKNYPTIEIGPASKAPLINFRELWSFRHLFLTLVWRTLRVRYKQTVIGVAWAILQPLFLTMIFTVIFGRFAGMSSNGQPYPIFILSGLLIWNFISQAFGQGSASIVNNAHLITKIYFPRIILILVAVTTCFVDLLCAFSLLVAMMIWYGISPSIGALAFIPMLLVGWLTVIGLSLWFGALYVPYRDVGHLLPFITTVWMFLSPVIYPSNLLPEKYMYLYALNPLAPVIETSRWAFSGGVPPAALTVAISVAVSLVLCISGLWFFRKKEPTFSDIV
jgi:lipopolysaccharide transport system permease protein